jgi:hypothetical protein
VRQPSKFHRDVFIYCTVISVLLEELQTQPLTFSHFYSPTTVGITIAPLQTVSHTTVLTIALSRATPIPVLSRTLGAFDCRLISSARRLAAD